MSMAWQDFKLAARGGEPEHIPVALIVDSPWLPGYAGIDTRDYFLYPEKWLEINLSLLDRFPSVAWIPGFWVEYGMAAEPSAFGARIRFYPDRPPSVEPVSPTLEHWAAMHPADPQTDGLMPLVLRRYQDAEERLNALGLGVRIVAARGPLTVASWLTGIGGLMEGIIAQPALVNHILDAITTTLIDWLQAQLDSVRNPEGILLLDDLVGMVSRRHYQALVGPCLQRIFERFAGMVRLYHNDTPCPHLLESLAETGFDVFNFSHEMDIAQVKARMGKGVALMGNVAPLGLGVRGEPEQVYQAALECLEKGAPGGGMILSFGGGVSPETKAENIDALARAAAEWPVRQ